MAFLPTHQRANMGFGICGFANTVDTLSAIKYATVKPPVTKYIYGLRKQSVNTHVGGEDDPPFKRNWLNGWLKAQLSFA